MITSHHGNSVRCVLAVLAFVPPQQPSSVFVEGDTNRQKSFEIDRLLNRRTVKKGKGLAIKYLVRWTGYGPEWDRWYNVKDLDNAADLVRA